MTIIAVRTPLTAAFVTASIDTEAAVEPAARILHAKWQEILARPSSGFGKLYQNELRTVQRNGKWSVVPVGPRADSHISAPPGQPPNADLFRQSMPSEPLWESIKMHPVKDGWRVGTNQWHGLYLEYGIGPGFRFKHPAGITVAPRPHARTALELVKDQMPAGIVGGLRTAVLFEVTRINILDIRRGLLQYSAALGNLSALFGIRIPVLGRFRGAALGLERGLGDFDAFISGKLDQRVAYRIVGRKYGQLIANMTGGIPGGFGKRVANRTLSKYLTSPALKQIFPRG